LLLSSLFIFIKLSMIAPGHHYLADKMNTSFICSIVCWSYVHWILANQDNLV